MSEKHEPDMTRKYSLGLIKIPDNTYEHDMAVSNKYQNFSAEVLRLSLLGIAAIGFLLTNTIFKGSSGSSQADQSDPTGILISAGFRYSVALSLICLGVSAGCALLHSFASADTIAWHLRVIRRELRKAEGDDEKAEIEREKRKNFLTWEIRFKYASGMFLWLGASFLAASFITLLRAVKTIH